MDRQNWEEEANIDSRRVQAAWWRKSRIFLGIMVALTF